MNIMLIIVFNFSTLFSTAAIHLFYNFSRFINSVIRKLFPHAFKNCYIVAFFPVDCYWS